MRKIVLSRDVPSASAISLAAALGCIRRRDKVGRVKRNTTVINWGCGSTLTDLNNRRVINTPQAVRVCANKLLFFQTLRRLQSTHMIPEFTTDITTARQWVSESGVKVMCRTLLTSHSGQGVVVATTPDEVVDAPLYTKYCPGLEYRVHCTTNGVFKVVQKRRRNGLERVEGQNLIKNHVNGWIFASGVSHELPQGAEDGCVQALTLLELDFCAFDVRYSPTTQDWVILEGNTAPGLEGSTVNQYANELEGLINNA